MTSVVYKPGADPFFSLPELPDCSLSPLLFETRRCQKCCDDKLNTTVGRMLKAAAAAAAVSGLRPLQRKVKEY